MLAQVEAAFADGSRSEPSDRQPLASTRLIRRAAGDAGHR
jgi:hypothetical protein